jgi:hypothetical protein
MKISVRQESNQFFLLQIYLLINVEINNAIYTIINIYAPNNMNKRNTFFKQVDRFINEYSIGQIIPAEDYNDISVQTRK